MIIGDHRNQVINNIADHAQQGLFNEKVEIDDPQMTSAESLDVINQFWQDQTHWRARFDNLIARTTMRGITDWFNHDTTFCGLENLKPLSPTQGAVITSNHFNQLDNTVIRKLAQKKSSSPVYRHSRNQSQNGRLDRLFDESSRCLTAG